MAKTLYISGRYKPPNSSHLQLSRQEVKIENQKLLESFHAPSFPEPRKTSCTSQLTLKTAVQQPCTNVVRAVGAATAEAPGCNWHRRAVKETVCSVASKSQLKTESVAELHLIGARTGIVNVQLLHGWVIGDLKAHLQGLMGVSYQQLRLWRGQPLELPEDFIAKCPPLEEAASLIIEKLAPPIDADEPENLEADRRKLLASRSLDPVDDEKELLSSGPCFTVWVPPLDSALLMRRAKGLRRCITYQAWQAGDEQALEQSQQAAEARAKAARDDAATKQAKSAAQVAAWAQRIARRPKFLRAGAAVEVRHALVLELRAPPSNGSGGVGVVPGRARRITPADALVVVSKAPVPSTTNGGSAPVASASASSERDVCRDPNWWVVSTKDGWLGTIASGDLVSRRKPALSAEEQYLADAGEARRKDAAAIAEERQKWGQRDWRRALVPRAAPNDGTAVDARGKANSSHSPDASAEAWRWLLKRLEGRRLKAVDLFVSAPGPVSDEAAGSRMEREALWRAFESADVPLPAEDFALVWQDLDPSGSGSLTLRDFELALREKRRLSLKMKPSAALDVHGGNPASTNARRSASASGNEENHPHVAMQREAYDQWLQNKR